jgi:hypothetical protein
VSATIGGGSAHAADGNTLRTITADLGPCSVGTGVAFDGSRLLTTCWYDRTIRGASPIDGHRVATFTVDGGSVGGFGAVAFDRGRGALWACGTDNFVYRIPMPASNVSTSTVTATQLFPTGGCIDGLAYDGTDDTLYVSGDAASLVAHYSVSGQSLGQLSVSGKLGGCGNSGIAVGGSSLLLANNGCSEIYRANKTITSSVLFAHYPARIEDLECDDVTFAVSGKAAIWAKDAYDNVLNAFELDKGTCGFGGLAPRSPKSSTESLDIVQLGDSYSAGNGAVDPSGGTTSYYGPKNCYRSYSNWGEQYADFIRSRGVSVHYTNAACGGATVKHFDLPNDRKANEQTIPFDARLPLTDPSLQNAADNACGKPRSPDEVVTATPTAEIDLGLYRVHCVRALRPQVDNLTSKTDLVLTTIGGNDVGFSTIAEQCFGRRDRVKCEEAVTRARAIATNTTPTGFKPTETSPDALDTRGLAERVRTALQHAKDKLRPDAQIYYVAYPHLTLDRPDFLNDYTCTRKVAIFICDEETLVGSYDVRTNVRNLATAGDDIQRAVVAELNAQPGARIRYFDSTKQVFAGHEPDPEPDTTNPQGWLWDIQGGGSQLGYFYHPNGIGQTKYSTVLSGSGAVPPGTKTRSHTDVVLLVDSNITFDRRQTFAQYINQIVDVWLADPGADYRFALFASQGKTVRALTPGFVSFTRPSTELRDLIKNLGPGSSHRTLDEFLTGPANDRLDWRPGAQKLAIHFGKSDDANLNRGLIAKTSLGIDPVAVYEIDPEPSVPSENWNQLAALTGGRSFAAATDPEVLSALNSIDTDLQQVPLTWLAKPSQNVKRGSSATFTAAGNTSADFVVQRYDWDFDGDLVTDMSTTTPTASFVFNTDGDFQTTVRVVAADGRASLASGVTTVDSDGDGLRGADDSCPNVTDPAGLDTDGDWIGDACDPTPGLPSPLIPRGQTDLVITGSGVENPASTTASFTVLNKGPFAAQQIQVAIQVPGAQNVTPSNCTAIPNQIICVIGLIESGAQHRLDVTYSAPPLGSVVAIVNGTLPSQSTDLVPFDNTITVSLISDRVPPVGTARASRPPDQNGWYQSPVSIKWRFTDPAPSSGPPTTPTPTVVSTDGKDQIITSGSSCDPNGNCATATTTVSYDATPPVVTVVGNAGIYTAGQRVKITCTAKDATSGIAVSDCPAIDALAASLGAGPHQFQATATDIAGNTTNVAYTVTVVGATDLVQPRSCAVEFDASSNLGSTFVANLQVANNGVALPLWHLTWDYKADERVTSIASSRSGGTGTNGALFVSGPAVDIYGTGANATFRAGDSLATPIWLAGSWSATATKTLKPVNFRLNGRLCSANVHGTRYDKA